jgi:hypothetical protein
MTAGRVISHQVVREKRPCGRCLSGGRIATVARLETDYDGHDHVAVTLDDDPGADLHDWYGRYLYFAPDEVEPVTSNDLGQEL